MNRRMDCHNYNIRSKYKLHVVKTRTKVGEHALRISLPQCINETPAFIETEKKHRKTMEAMCK